MQDGGGGQFSSKRSATSNAVSLSLSSEAEAKIVFNLHAVYYGAVITDFKKHTRVLSVAVNIKN